MSPNKILVKVAIIYEEIITFGINEDVEIVIESNKFILNVNNVRE